FKTTRFFISELRSHDPYRKLGEFLVNKSGSFLDLPCCGFETVTYMLEGKVQQEDFAGHKGTFGPGESQWMTAGHGIVHSEIPLRLPRKQEDERAYGLQLWINCQKSTRYVNHSTRNSLMVRSHALDRKMELLSKSLLESHTASSLKSIPPHRQCSSTSRWTRTQPSHKPSETYNGFFYVLSGTAYIGDPNSQPEAKARHTLLFS
ncbi:RmlC-like cupin domain-containing protein, partial [Linnemannia elongata]